MKRAFIAAMVVLFGTIFAAAQNWPTKLVKIVVPFAAVTGFADPAVQFGLQFKNATAAQQTANAAPSASTQAEQVSSPDQTSPSTEKPPENPQVVSLDKFRKK